MNDKEILDDKFNSSLLETGELDTVESVYYQKKKNGMDFIDIRRELEAEGISEEDIRLIIRNIDDAIIREELSSTKQVKLDLTYWVGVILIVSGLLLTVGTYTGVIRLGGYVIIAFGPVMVGLSMIAGKKRREIRGKINSHRKRR